MALALAGKPPQPLPVPAGELPVIALTPISPTPTAPMTPIASTTVVEPTDPQTPLGNNTPSPEIQNNHRETADPGEAAEISSQ